MFVTFNGYGGKKMVIRKDAITAIQQEGLAVQIYTGSVGFVVKDSYEEVLKMVELS